MPVTGLQFSGAHKVCAIGGFIPVIGAGFDIIDASLYGLEGDKIMQTAAISGAALNLFGSKWLFSGASSSIDNFAEAGVKYTDANTGVCQGSSYIDTVYAIRIPKGTTVYTGPVGPQGGVYVGGYDIMQTYIETPWTFEVVGKTGLR